MDQIPSLPPLPPPARAVLLGFAAGLRSQVPVALLAIESQQGRFDPGAGRLARRFASSEGVAGSLVGLAGGAGRRQAPDHPPPHHHRSVPAAPGHRGHGRRGRPLRRRPLPAPRRPPGSGRGRRRRLGRQHGADLARRAHPPPEPAARRGRGRGRGRPGHGRDQQRPRYRLASRRGGGFGRRSVLCAVHGSCRRRPPVRHPPGQLVPDRARWPPHPGRRRDARLLAALTAALPTSPQGRGGRAVVLTHAHADHIGFAHQVKATPRHRLGAHATPSPGSAGSRRCGCTCAPRPAAAPAGLPTGC